MPSREYWTPRLKRGKTADNVTGIFQDKLERSRKAKWKLGVLLPGSQKLSRYTIKGGDLAALAARLADMPKKAAATGPPSCLQ